LKIKIGLSGKKFSLNVKKVSALGMLSGLMFRTKKVRNLLFDFGSEGKWTIHSFFVFFSFLAVWLDEKNRVLDYKIVKPFCFSVVPKQKFVKLVEIPVTDGNKMLISNFPSVRGKV